MWLALDNQSALFQWQLNLLWYQELTAMCKFLGEHSFSASKMHQNFAAVLQLTDVSTK